MKGKPLRIDWDELETAFSNRNEELVYYLDTITGRVHLDGEGEDDDFDDDDEVSAEAPQPDRDDATRLYIEPPDAAVETGWMREFIDSSELDEALAARLREALDQEASAIAFRDALQDEADVRDRWFLFRSDRIEQHVEAWLTSHEIHPAEPPPWKS